MSALTGSAASPAGSSVRTVHAIVWQKNTVSFASLDVATLAPRGGLLPLGRANGSVATDRLGDRVAVASADVGVVVVDTKRMRVVWRLPGGPHVRAMSWLSPRRLLVAQHGAVLLLDPVTRRTLAGTLYEGSVVSSARWRDGLVLLAERASGKLEPARLVVVDSGARVRTVELDRIESGADGGENNQGPYRTARPGLAVDTSAGIAFVAGGLVVARVDLRTLGTSYAGAERTVQKLSAGPRRIAAWLGNGTLAVAGSDHSSTDAGLVSTPFGLRYVKSDRVSIVDPSATDVRIAGGMALAYGERYESGRSTGAGLAAYDSAGTLRWQIFGDSPVTGTQFGGGLVYAYVSGGSYVGGWKVVEPATGSILWSPATPRLDYFHVIG